MKVTLLGDSDVSQWPSSENPFTVTTVSGQPGATVSQIIVPPELSPTVIVCAGENDISCNIPLWQSEQALRTLLLQLSKRQVFFLGPKLKPWLENEPAMRPKYWLMHLFFQRVIQTEFPNDRVHFIDCLFLFCDTNNNNKGTVYKAHPLPQYFQSDQLHLSREGYRKWKVLLQQLLVPQQLE